MANVIKYNTGSVPANAIKSGNFDIGVNFGGYGSTSATNYYNGKTPNVSGYTIYVANGISSPILYAAANDAELIGLSNQLGGSGINTVGGALSYFNSSSTITCVNVDYSNIVTSGVVLNLDAGFTPSYPETGTVWTDISGSGYTGTLVNGPTYSSDGGGCIVFDGTDDYVSLPINSSFNTPSITFEVFAKLNSTPSRQILMLNWQGNSLEVNADRSVVMFNYSSAGQVGASTSASIFNWGSWTHFVGVYDNSSQSLKTYINGVLQATTTSVPSTIYSVGVHKIAGTDYSLGIYGNVATARHYNRALSAAEVLQNYYAGFKRLIPTDGIVLYLDGNNTDKQVMTASTANDISGNNYNGTLVNGVTIVRDGQRSFSFDGTDDYINCGNVMPSGNYTKVFIFKVPNFSFSDNLVSGGADGSHYVYLAGTPYLRTGHFNGGEAVSNYVTIANTWNFAVVTFSTTSGFAIYQNGNTVVGSDPSTGAFTGGNKLNLGSYGGSFLLQGNIAVTIIYNRVLTTTEILSIYNAYKGRFGYV
jgi:hypothetical protein